MPTKRFSDQVSLRRETRAKSLGGMRSFAPSEAKKFLMLNPASPIQATTETSNGGLSDTSRANSFFFKSTCSASAALRKSRNDSTADSDMLGSVRANGLTPMNVPLAALFVPGEALSNTNEDYVLLLHQEAMYRQLFFPEVDHWFTSLVEAAWDERDRLVLTSEEIVQRYWLTSDETKGRETISHFQEDAEQNMRRDELVKEICMEELVQRSRITQEFLASSSGLQSTILSGHVTALSKASPPRTARKSSASLTPKPPSRCDAQTPVRQEQTLRTPQTERHPVAHDGQDNFPSADVMTTFLFGSFPQVLQFVVDAEDTLRSRIESRWYVECNTLSRQQRNYKDRSALLRFPNGARRLMLEDAEVAERRLIENCYYNMMIEACTKLEVLHRRHLTFNCDPDGRRAIETLEREEWLYARRAECASIDAQNLTSHEAAKAAKLADFNKQQFLSRQRDIFLRAESDERHELLRRESRMFSLLMESALDGRLLAAPAQHIYSKRHETIVWNAAAYNGVYLAEIRGRGKVVSSEQEVFRRLQTEEARAFVHTRRNILVNDDVEAQLKEFDRLIEKARTHSPSN